MSHRQTFAVWIQVCGDRVCVCVCVWKYVYVCMFCGLCSRCMFMSDGSCQRYNKFSYCLLMFINWKMLMPWNRRSGLKVDSHASVLSEREFSAANSKSSEWEKEGKIDLSKWLTRQWRLLIIMFSEHGMKRKGDTHTIEVHTDRYQWR